MIEVFSNLHVGNQYDEEVVRGRADWFVISAAKFPYHKEALGYAGREAPKDHPEYSCARRPGSLVLNLVDADDAKFIRAETIDAAVEAIHANIASYKVLVHCNQGASRSPTIAFLYLLKHTDALSRHSFDRDLEEFLRLYPAYEPKRGMSDYARLNWSKYVQSNAVNLEEKPMSDNNLHKNVPHENKPHEPKKQEHTGLEKYLPAAPPTTKK